MIFPVMSFVFRVPHSPDLDLFTYSYYRQSLMHDGSTYIYFNFMAMEKLCTFNRHSILNFYLLWVFSVLFYFNEAVYLCAAQVSFEVKILLPQPSKYCGCKHALPWAAVDQQCASRCSLEMLGSGVRGADGSQSYKDKDNRWKSSERCVPKLQDYECLYFSFLELDTFSNYYHFDLWWVYRDLTPL